MSGTNSKRLPLLAATAVAAAALIALPATFDADTAFAQGKGYQGGAEHQSGGGHGGSHAGGGGGQKGTFTGGQMRGKGGKGSVPDSSHVESEDGDSDDEKKGPKFMGGRAGSGGAGGSSGGGKPVWAQEGIPEVELGRLNVSRSPGHVIDRALAEALEEYAAEPANLYSLTAEDFANVMETQYETVTRIDSPLQNLGLYRDLMEDGVSELSTKGVTPASQLDLAAILLGSASDKTMSVSKDTVTALNAIMGLPTLSEADTATLATKADEVRAGILSGHGL